MVTTYLKLQMNVTKKNIKHLSRTWQNRIYLKSVTWEKRIYLKHAMWQNYFCKTCHVTKTIYWKSITWENTNLFKTCHMTISNWSKICHVTGVRRMRRSDVNIFLFFLYIVYDKKNIFLFIKRNETIDAFLSVSCIRPIVFSVYSGFSIQ